MRQRAGVSHRNVARIGLQRFRVAGLLGEVAQAIPPRPHAAGSRSFSRESKIMADKENAIEEEHVNPQIDAHLNTLADLCCKTLEGDASELEARRDELLKSLLMSGYVRKSGKDLRADLEKRVKDRCREPSMHRGGALTGLSDRLQKRFEEVIRWHSEQPEGKSSAKAANISSATDA
jgi:hypothetical protein